VSIEALKWVWEHSESKGAARALMLAIANHLHANGTGCFAGQALLAKEAGVSDRTVRRLTKEQTQIGELKVDEYGGPPAPRSGRRTHSYSFPKMRDMLSDNLEVVGQTGEVVGQDAPGCRTTVAEEPLEPSVEPRGAADRMFRVLKANNARVRMFECAAVVVRAREANISDTRIDEAIGRAQQAGAMWPSYIEKVLALPPIDPAFSDLRASPEEEIADAR
jgi:hypothetical protein